MTEPGTTEPPADEEGSHASVGGNPDQPGGGRTEGETAVDEDMGTGDSPTG
jgi:hypothetical protein